MYGSGHFLWPHLSVFSVRTGSLRESKSLLYTFVYWCFVKLFMVIISPPCVSSPGDRNGPRSSVPRRPLLHLLRCPLHCKFGLPPPTYPLSFCSQGFSLLPDPVSRCLALSVPHLRRHHPSRTPVHFGVTTPTRSSFTETLLLKLEIRQHWLPKSYSYPTLVYIFCVVTVSCLGDSK